MDSDLLYLQSRFELIVSSVKENAMNLHGAFAVKQAHATVLIAAGERTIRERMMEPVQSTSENKMIMLYALTGPGTILTLTAIAVLTRMGLAGLTTNDGPHGLTEILFAFATSFGKNGQAFAGLSANTLFYNVGTAIAMMAGRFALVIPALCFAGLVARQKITPRSSGTLRTDSLSFGILLTAFLIIVTALSYLPVVTLGPVLGHLQFKI